MKKASEYATQILNSRLVGGQFNMTVLTDVMHELLSVEVQELVISRHATKDAAIVGIIKEQNAKWKAICRRVNKAGCLYTLNESGLYNYLSGMEELKTLVAQL